MYTHIDLEKCKNWCYENLSNCWYDICPKTLRVVCENNVLLCEPYGSDNFINRIAYEIVSKTQCYEYCLQGLTSFDNVQKNCRNIMFTKTEKLDFTLYNESPNFAQSFIIESNSKITPKNLQIKAEELIGFYKCKNPEIYDFKNYGGFSTDLLKIDSFYYRIKNFTECLFLENVTSIICANITNSNTEPSAYTYLELLTLNCFLLTYMKKTDRTEYVMDMTLDLLDTDFVYECS